MTESRGRMNYEMWKLARRMNQLMDEWMHAKFKGGADEAWQPAVDIVECRHYVGIFAELAGMTQDEIHVAVNGDTITLSGTRTLECADDQTGIHQMELARGAFRRSLRLPFAAEAESAEVSYDAGLLKIKVPKPDADRER